MIQKLSLHETSNENGTRTTDFEINKNNNNNNNNNNMLIKSPYFPHRIIHITWIFGNPLMKELIIRLIMY